MKFKIQAGAELDLLTKGEMSEALETFRQAWVTEIARGDRYRRFSGQAAISAGSFTIGGPDGGPDRADFGPRDGYVWSVKRLAVALGDGTPLDPTMENLAIYINEVSPANLVHPVFVDYQPFGSDELVLYPGDELVIAGSSLSSTGYLTVTGQAREIPMQLAWRLGE